MFVVKAKGRAGRSWAWRSETVGVGGLGTDKCLLSAEVFACTERREGKGTMERSLEYVDEKQCFAGYS